MALHSAVDSGDESTVEVLIDEGTDVSAQTSDGAAALHTATANRQLAEWDPTESYFGGEGPIKPTKANSLIDTVVGLNVRTKGYTALEQARECKHNAVEKVLRERCARG